MCDISSCVLTVCIPLKWLLAAQLLAVLRVFFGKVYSLLRHWTALYRVHATFTGNVHVRTWIVPHPDQHVTNFCDEQKYTG